MTSSLEMLSANLLLAGLGEPCWRRLRAGVGPRRGWAKRRTLRQRARRWHWQCRPPGRILPCRGPRWHRCGQMLRWRRRTRPPLDSPTPQLDGIPWAPPWPCFRPPWGNTCGSRNPVSKGATNVYNQMLFLSPKAGPRRSRLPSKQGRRRWLVGGKERPWRRTRKSSWGLQHAALPAVANMQPICKNTPGSSSRCLGQRPSI